jgi:hypothetical protein
VILTIRRTVLTPTSSIGELYVDGVFECYTLEDTVQEEGIKIDGDTAIPVGTYRVIIDFSNRFQKPLPHILNVPGFEGIRIHCGNTAADTEGCILLGQEKGANTVLFSRPAFNAFFAKLQTAGTAELTIS